MSVVLHDLGVELSADPSRVVARLFLPGEGVAPRPSRAGAIVRRLHGLAPDRVGAEADRLLREDAPRHAKLADQLLRNAETVAFRTGEGAHADPAESIVRGAAFTAEHAVEGAALCNPSAMRHPDQTGLGAGELRLAIALRGIGEGHISSIGFASAVIGGDGWRFAERERPLAQAVVGDGTWTRTHFLRILRTEGRLGQLANAVIRALPATFGSSDIERAIAVVPEDLSRRPHAHLDFEALRSLASTAYSADFSPGTTLSQRVLLPATDSESQGMEDARFVLTTDGDGNEEYRASYTAYDGRGIAPRLLTSPDLARFSTHRLTGDAAANKGMAFFPRPVAGTRWALTRTDGESLTIARSTDGLEWAPAGVVHTPRELWEVVQVGNCGSPIETDRGWLVLTHGVGPLRRYAIGALLLDLDDPARVIGRLRDPILEPTAGRRDGYVPNVVYSCGGIVHDGRLWLPYGVGDQRVRAGAVDLAELLDAMEPAA